MSSRQKRSNGGYGLRRKVAKKRLDEDFEYYFSKIGTHLETPAPKPVKDHMAVVNELVDANGKPDSKISECTERRPRGRPKKIHTSQNQEPDFSDPSIRFVDLKDKRVKRFKTAFLEDTETTKAVGEICLKNDAIMTVACEEEVSHVDCVVKRVKLETVLTGDEITGLQEEEVTSLPEGEKENLPEDGIHLEPESDTEEGLGVQMDESVHGDIDEGAVYEDDHDELDKDAALVKLKRKYKKGRLSQDAIQKLSQLSPDDKIECNECHKLLKPSSFRQHLRTHTGEKPFGCEVCEARFTRKGDVERHVRIVHNKQKPFKCCRCQRAFGDKKNLRWHLMNHDKKLFYVCEVCGFKFGKREYWENHVRFIHPVPGGLDMDDNNIERIGIEDEGEDRLRTLTKTLLVEDEAAVDDPSQDCAAAAAAVKSIQNRDNAVEDMLGTDVTLPFINNISKQEGIKLINLKSLNLANFVKIGRAKIAENVPSYARLVNQSDEGGIEAVVIQFDGSTAESSTLQTIPQLQPRFRQQHAANVIHVVHSQDMLQIVEAEEPQDQQSIVIETQDFTESGLSDPETPTVIDCQPDIQEQVVEVQDAIAHTSEGDSATVQYVNEDEEPSKVISIMLTDDGGTGSDTNNSSVQTLIEALLVAAKGDGESNDTQST